MAELYIDAMEVAIDIRSREYQEEIMHKAPEILRSELVDILEESSRRKKK